jgi:methyl-accepting chemotaxis protein
MVNQVDGGISLAQQAGDAITQIKTESDQVIKTVSDIFASLEEQSKTSTDMSVHIEKVSHMSARLLANHLVHFDNRHQDSQHDGQHHPSHYQNK